MQEHFLSSSIFILAKLLTRFFEFIIIIVGEKMETERRRLGVFLSLVIAVALGGIQFIPIPLLIFIVIVLTILFLLFIIFETSYEDDYLGPS